MEMKTGERNQKKEHMKKKLISCMQSVCLLTVLEECFNGGL